MALTYIDDYSKLVADMKRVLSTEPQVHVPESMLRNRAQAEFIARDLNLLLEHDVVGCKYHFKKREEKQYAC
ncbi:MAG TPA: hypothetical protein ENJ28_05050 [Gammaproteobacteria bacterium]|nr:hypothetical protein [Gammaproteobacteria bacterium]